MKEWRSLIGQCFGARDRAFAEHPSDEETAFELLGALRSRAVGWPTFERELRRQLGKMPKLDTDTEVERVRCYFEIWMLD